MEIGSNEPAAKPQRHGRLAASLAAQTLFAFLGGLALLLALHGWRLDAFFFYDDLPMIKRASPALGFGFADIFQVVGNGFWRPMSHLHFWLVESLFGRRPWAFNGAALVVHAGTGALVFLAARQVLALSVRLSLLVCLLFVSHLAGLGAILQLNAATDSQLGGMFLLAWIAWDRWLVEGHKVSATLLLIATALALMTKETAIVLPGLLAVWWVAQGVTREHWKRRALLLLAVTAVCAATAAWFLTLQATSRSSYLDQGRMDSGPVEALAQFLDYIACYVFPNLHIVEWPFLPYAFSPISQVAARAMGGVALLAGVILFARKPRWRTPLGLVGMALLPLVPVALLQGPLQARYLAPGLPFLVLALGVLLQRASAMDLRWRREVLFAVGALWSVYLLSALASPTLHRYARTCREVEAFVTAARAQDWPANEVVAIFHHPHPGEPRHRWSYCQLLHELFVPEADRVTIILDKRLPGTPTYRWDGARLLRVPALPKPAKAEDAKNPS